MSWRIPDFDVRIVTIGAITYRRVTPPWLKGRRPVTTYNPISEVAA